MPGVSTTALLQKRCVPCEGGVPPLTAEQASQYLRDVPGWALSADHRTIDRAWTFRDFREALRFVNAVAELAEAENHHPDIRLFSYRRVHVELTTHAIRGLSDNDFILAAKINVL
ncbi:MAG: 4a-hydroxytetrahydrobiopterin dehydratase [Parcubacteria group bacterium Gr01-1014_38]|nr:MAG: 4a-hydroxytetrahydrobiopterin dehydratase [Parcubacteria group bacterium Gr01-1014_38]